MLADGIMMRARVAGATAGRVGRAASRRLLRAAAGLWQGRGPDIEQLLLRPRDLRTADPSFASEIYHGHFGLAGAVALTGSDSPFSIPPPSPDWERELQGFGWLRHLGASGDEISREHGRALVRDWIKLHGKQRGIAWQPEILARRIISWLSHSPVFLEGADPQFYENVMESLTRQLRVLRNSYADAPDGLARLTALGALIYADLCASEELPGAASAIGHFGDELDRQILADGGHVSRNPQALVELLLDLLPLRQCFIARDRQPPRAMTAAIDRIMPMIRFFRLGDGTLARFNGCGPTPTDNLAAVLAHDDAHGRPLTLADQSGYCRLERERGVVIVDCGRPPPLAHSRHAHAGCLAFELSSGQYPVIVNCGAPGRRHRDWRRVARATAAHSTLTLADTSSSQLRESVGGGEQGAVWLSGPANVTAAVNTSGGVQELRAAHDGYDTRFGVTHARRLRLAATGEMLLGEDMLITPHGLKGAARTEEGMFAIRFHLHPSVRAELAADGRAALLLLPNREGWRLVSKDGPLAIEESVYLADLRGPRRTAQVVLYGRIGAEKERRVNWALEKSASAPSDGARTGEDALLPEEEELPLE